MGSIVQKLVVSCLNSTERRRTEGREGGRKEERKEGRKEERDTRYM